MEAESWDEAHAEDGTPKEDLLPTHSAPKRRFVHEVQQLLQSLEFRTFLSYCASYGCVGLALASLGPSLLELADNTNSSISQMGYVFIMRSAGYLLGSAVGGPMFDKFKPKGNIILTVVLLITAISTVIIPFVAQLWLLAAFVSTQGMAMGVLDTGGNVLVIRMYGSKVGPYLQALHCTFGFGAVASPPIIGALIGQFRHSLAVAFGLIGLFTATSAFWTLAYPTPLPKIPDPSRADARKHRVYDRAVILLVAAFLGLYVGCETSAGGFFPTYAEKMGLMSRSAAAYLATGFWGALAVGRLFAIPISIKLSAAKMLWIDLVGSSIALAVLIFGPNTASVLIFTVVLYGLSLASAFPTAIHLGEHFVEVTGNAAGVFVVGASTGEMAIPVLIANLFDVWGMRALPYVLSGVLVLLTLEYAALLIVGTYGKRCSAVNTVDDIQTEYHDEQRESTEQLEATPTDEVDMGELIANNNNNKEHRTDGT